MATREDRSLTSDASGARREPIPASGIVGDLSHWPTFSHLRRVFAKTVRLCCVFNFETEPGLESLIVTHDDKVWGLGRNAYGCLGNGTEEASWTPIEISVLSGKGIRSFAYGAKHVLALTGTGEVYGWGKNDYKQVGKPNATLREIHIPTLVYNWDDPAEEIACGNRHSVCRTRTGAVYCWGTKHFGVTGTGLTGETSVPTKVERHIANLKCCGISCSDYSTIAVFENGDVYAWGDNAHGNLGIGSKKPSIAWHPVKVDFLDTIIKKVACGDKHALALADDGSLFVWGSNHFGQLGIEDKNDQYKPVRHSALRTTYGRIVDIAASGRISAVMTESSTVLAWGKCRKKPAVRVPTVVSCLSLQDVFATWSFRPQTPVPLVVTSTTTALSESAAAQRSSLSEWDGNLTNTVAEHFDNPKLSDVRFRVEKEIIYAHRTVLEFQSEYFRTMFQGPWKDIKNDIIEVTGTSYLVYYAFVRFFYMGVVDLSSAEGVELLALANWNGEHVLKAIDQHLLRDTVSVENCASIYAAAVQCGSKDLEDFCWGFALENLTAVIQTPGFENLPESMLRKFIAEAARKEAFRN